MSADALMVLPLLGFLAAMELIDWRTRNKTTRAGAHNPGHPSAHHSAGDLAESPERA